MRTDYRIVPVLSLLCNLVVVTIGSWRFARAGALNWRRSWPLFATSVPLAWVGGRLPVSELLFIGLLSASLIVAGFSMLWRRTEEEPQLVAISWREPVIGGVLGLLAGITGIGGGIFLAPVLHLRRWDRGRAIAATCALFILINSISGLAGQLAKSGLRTLSTEVGHYWLLFPAVALGGAAGAAMGATRLKPRHLAVLTAVLVLYVGVQLAFRFAHMLASGR